MPRTKCPESALENLRNYEAACDLQPSTSEWSLRCGSPLFSGFLEEIEEFLADRQDFFFRVMIILAFPILPGLVNRLLFFPFFRVTKPSCRNGPWSFNNVPIPFSILQKQS
jgi:hypothetical protein